jgi:PleD family two-component response regulator
MKILIVSSSEADVRWIANILGEEDIVNIDSCTNSTDAIQLLAVNQYNLVLSEAYLAVLTGFDLKKLMDSFGYDIPVLFFTDKVNDNTRKEAKYAGVIDCFSTDHLDKELPSVLAKIDGVQA